MNKRALLASQIAEAISTAEDINRDLGFENPTLDEISELLTQAVTKVAFGVPA